MATLSAYPSAMCFSSDVADIVFSGVASESAVLQLYATCGGNLLTLLDETVYRSGDGSVTVGGLSSLLEPYARQYLRLTLDGSLQDSAGTVLIPSVTVLFSAADVGTTAADFTANHFLTTLNGTKLTAPGRNERIYAYGLAAGGGVTVKGEILTAAGQLQTLTASLTAASVAESISEFEVGPDNVAALLAVPTGARLLGYTVTAGSRVQDFEVLEDTLPPAPSLLFTNSFGCREFIHCVGTHRKESKYERKATRVFGRLRSYRVQEDRQFTANTGWLNEAMADWADELLRSQEIYLWVNGSVGREVVITDSRSEISNEDDNMPAFELTYGYAQRIHNVMQPTRAGRIFDNTFDRTFN